MYSEINFNLAPHAGSGFERNLNCEDRRVDWVCYPEGYACLQRPFPLGSHAMIDDFSPEIAGSPFKTNDMGTVVGVARTRMDAGDVDGKFCDRRIEIQGQNGIRWWYKETSLVRILKVFDQYCPEYLYVVSHSPTAPSCAASVACANLAPGTRVKWGDLNHTEQYHHPTWPSGLARGGRPRFDTAAGRAWCGRGR